MNKIGVFVCTFSMAFFCLPCSASKKTFYNKNDPMTCDIKLPMSMAKVFRDKAEQFIKARKYQEMIWYLSENGQVNNAKYVKIFLRELMKKHDFANSGSPIATLGGITTPVVYLLPCNVKAVFKEKKSHPSSNYRSEVASYLIDDYFSFNLVPMTVKRKINGKIGSLQYFVQDTYDIDKRLNYKKSSKLHIFDYITANKDRNSGNLLFLNGREIAIDHGLALRVNNPIGKNLVIYDKIKAAFNIKADPIRSQIAYPRSDPEIFRKERKILDKLVAVNYVDLKELLGKTLKKENIKLLYSKIAKLIYFTRGSTQTN